MTTAAGTGLPGARLDRPALHALLGDPAYALTVADDGTVYFTANQVVAKLAGGWVRLVAGRPYLRGYRDGLATKGFDSDRAMFQAPVGLALDKQGRIFVADSGNHVIRLIEKGRVSTYAGTGERGGHDGPAREVAQFNDPQGLAIDSKGRLYVSELYPRRIRVILPE